MRKSTAGLAAVFVLVASLYGASADTPTCGGSLTNQTGTIDSSDISDPGKGGNCTWTISRNETSGVIMLNFDSLSLEAGGTDNVTIYAGNDSHSQVVVAFTSHGGPEMVIVSGEVATIVFYRGNQNKTTTKFSMNYNSENCSTSAQGSQGILKSPVYLSGTGDFKCTYAVSMPAGVPVLSFPALSLPVGRLLILKNLTTVANITGTKQQDDIVLAAGAVDLTFVLSIKNDSSAQSFTAQYQTVFADCSGKLKADKLTDLALPSTTPFPVTCYWKITAKDAGSQVYIATTVGQLTGSDSVLVYDGGSMYSGVIGGTNKGTPWYVSSGQNMTVVAYLGSQTSRADSLSYKQDKFSKLYKLNSTGTPTDKITLSGKDVAGQNVSLQFLAGSAADAATAQVRVDMASDSKLTKTTVQIQDSKGNVLLTFGKDMQLFPVSVADSRALVVISNLTGDDVVSLSAAVATSADCNQLYSGDTGLITASASTTENRTCTVAVTSSKASLLTITSLNLCKGQTLEIYAGLGATAPKLATLTGSYPTLSQIHFPAGSAPRFTWTDTINATGCGTPMLTASYSPEDTVAACGTLDPKANSGTVQSPDYPNQYPLNYDCAWTFPAQNNSLLYMAYNTLELAEKHTVTVNNGSAAQVYNANTTTLPDDQITVDKSISVAFSSAVSNNAKLEATARGLSMNYKILTCGGYLDNPTANISSPKGVNSTIECIWIIKVVPTGKDKSVNVVSVGISAANWVNSSSGSLSLYDGGSMRAPAINVNLTKGSNITAYSRHNLMIIQYTFSILKLGSSEQLRAPPAPFSFNLTYKTFSCNTSCQCRNGDCMLPGWKCDGVIQCPDGSDEIGCKFPPPTTIAPTPVPGKPAKKKGVEGYWIFICLVIGLVLGIFVAILIPKAIRRWRLRNYNGGLNNYGTLNEDA